MNRKEVGCREFLSMRKVVLLRHGESEWNRENRFTCWTDVALSENGFREAMEAGRILRREGYAFDNAFTSVLKRAIKTLWIVLEEMDLMWIPVLGSWRLNERHYGALQGLNKAETAEKYGMEQVELWRRSFNVRPPALTPDDSRYPGNDPRYAGLGSEEIPLTECLEDTTSRFLPYCRDVIAPVIRSGRRVIVLHTGIRCARWSCSSTRSPRRRLESSTSLPGSPWSTNSSTTLNRSAVTTWVTSKRPNGRHMLLPIRSGTEVEDRGGSRKAYLLLKSGCGVRH